MKHYSYPLIVLAVGLIVLVSLNISSIYKISELHETITLQDELIEELNNVISLQMRNIEVQDKLITEQKKHIEMLLEQFIKQTI